MIKRKHFGLVAASDPFLKILNESEHQQHHETGAKKQQKYDVDILATWAAPLPGKRHNRMKAMRSQQQQTTKSKNTNILKPPGTLAQKTKQQQQQ